MVFLNRVFYENIGISKYQISGSFVVFLQEYIKKMIEYYIQKMDDELLEINTGDIRIREDKNVIQYILLITENPETSKLIHDKIYGMIHYFAKFVTESGKKCSFESVIETYNSANILNDLVVYFLKPIETFYIQKINKKLIVSIEAVYIQQETFYLYIEICCSNLWINGSLSGAFKELVYFYFFGIIQNFNNWLMSRPNIPINFDNSKNKLEFIFEYISENYSENLGKHIKNQILKYEESKHNWDNISIYRIYQIPEVFIDYCKVIIQYLLIEFIYTGKCIAESNEKKKIYPVDLFLGMEDAELLELPVFFKNIRNC
jgi:hypothetical protein